MIEKYTNIEKLTVTMINEYIEKVVVHESTGGRKGKYRKQQVDVYFNFIGNCQVPQSEESVSYTHLPSPRDVEESRMPSSA